MKRAISVVVVFALLALPSGCKPTTLQPMYCEGGPGPRGGGACMVFTAGSMDGNPATIGAAKLIPNPAGNSNGPGKGQLDGRYLVRRAGTSKQSYQLWNDKGEAVGTLEQNGYWITVTVSAQSLTMRSDTPGPFA